MRILEKETRNRHHGIRSHEKERRDRDRAPKGRRQKRDRRFSYLEPNRVPTLKQTFFLKLQHLRKRAYEYDPKEIPTQEVRGEIILDLRLLKEVALREAQQEGTGGRYGKTQRKWADVAGRLSRIINIIMRDYDALKIKQKLTDLEAFFKEIALKTKEEGFPTEGSPGQDLEEVR